jgi:hypothetical protein
MNHRTLTMTNLLNLTHTTRAGALMMAGTIIAGLLPLSARGANFSTAKTANRPCLPLSASRPPRRAPTHTRITTPIITHTGPTAIYEAGAGAGVIRGDGDGLSEFWSGLADALTAAFPAPSSIRVSARFGFGHPGFAIRGFGRFGFAHAGCGGGFRGGGRR